MSDKIYAQFNTLTITGRLSHAEMVENNGNSWGAVTLLTELQDDGTTVAVTFNTTNGLMSLYKSGWLNNGRRVTVTGHLASFAQVYLDKAGTPQVLKRPRLHLTKAVVFEGGLGPAKKEDSSAAPVDDMTQVAKAAGIA